MRIGNDLLIFTKKGPVMSAVLLSRSFHEEEKIDEVKLTEFVSLKYILFESRIYKRCMKRNRTKIWNNSKKCWVFWKDLWILSHFANVCVILDIFLIYCRLSYRCLRLILSRRNHWQKRKTKYKRWVKFSQDELIWLEMFCLCCIVISWNTQIIPGCWSIIYKFTEKYIIFFIQCVAPAWNGSDSEILPVQNWSPVYERIWSHRWKKWNTCYNLQHETFGLW